MTKKLLLLACAHIGHKNVDYEALDRYLEWAKKGGHKILLLGDIFEVGLPQKANKMMEQNLIIDEQFDRGVALFLPYAKQIIGQCTSNHSNRVWETVGFDLDKAFANTLKIPYFAMNGQVLWEGKKVTFHHGFGAGVNEWGDAQKLLTNYPDSDIVAVSHRHYMATSAFQNNLNKRTHLVNFVRSGSLIKKARYADMAQYQGRPNGFAVVENKNGTIRMDVSGVPWEFE